MASRKRRTLYRWCIEIWWTQGWNCRTRVEPDCDICNLGFIIFQCPLTIVHHLYNVGLLRLAISTHVAYFAKNIANIIFPLNSWLSFSECVVFYGDITFILSTAILVQIILWFLSLPGMCSYSGLPRHWQLPCLGILKDGDINILKHLSPHINYVVTLSY